jgi:hypothetical protein
LNARWVNNPARIVVAEYKPLQLRHAADAGLRVPRTLVINDHGAAVAFGAEIDGPVVQNVVVAGAVRGRAAANHLHDTGRSGQHRPGAVSP